MEIPFTNWCLILHLLISLDTNNKETANVWEYQVGIYAIIANCVCMWKNRMKLVETCTNTKVSLLVVMSWVDFAVIKKCSDTYIMQTLWN